MLVRPDNVRDLMRQRSSITCPIIVSRAHDFRFDEESRPIQQYLDFYFDDAMAEVQVLNRPMVDEHGDATTSATQVS